MDEINNSHHSPTKVSVNRPTTVKWGLILLVVSLCITVIHGLMVPAHPPAHAAADTVKTAMGMAYLALAIIAVITLLLIWGIAVGWRWVLITYTVLFVIGLIVSLFNIKSLTAVYIAQDIIVIVGLLLLYSGSARQWFKDKRNS